MSGVVVCRQCGELLTADPLGICERCQRANALSFAACDTCCATAAFDANGRVVVTHEPGCRDYREFKRKANGRIGS
jgi:hypothetical protein